MHSLRPRPTRSSPNSLPKPAIAWYVAWRGKRYAARCMARITSSQRARLTHRHSPIAGGERAPASPTAMTLNDQAEAGRRCATLNLGSPVSCTLSDDAGLRTPLPPRRDIYNPVKKKAPTLRFVGAPSPSALALMLASSGRTRSLYVTAPVSALRTGSHFRLIELRVLR